MIAMISSTLDPLVKQLREMAVLSGISAFLGWDQETYMPSGAIDSRAEQLALMEELLGKFPKKFTKKHREYFNARGRIKNLGDIKKIDLRVVMIVECELSKELAQSLHDFLLPLLRYNPKLRASAQDCFSHPFLSRTDVMAATNSAAVGSKDHASGDEKGEDARVEQRVGIIDGDEEKA